MVPGGGATVSLMPLLTSTHVWLSALMPMRLIATSRTSGATPWIVFIRLPMALSVRVEGEARGDGRCWGCRSSNGEGGGGGGGGGGRGS